jgi:hypothetical protein
LVRRLSWIGAALACASLWGALLGPAGAGAAGGAVTTLDNPARATGVVAYAGWAAWSRFDPASRQYALLLRSPAGTVAPAAVATRSAEFDVSLGPTAGGGVAAVYSRCARGTCHLYELALGGTAGERRLAVPGGGSTYDPAIWGGRIAFLRAHRGRGQRRPQDMFEWVMGSRHLLALRLPRNEYSARDLREFPELHHTEGVTGTIGFLTLHGSEVAYTRDAPITDAVEAADLWLERPGGAPRLLARIHTGGAASGTRTYLSPAISGGWLYTYREGADLGSAWVRFSIAGLRLQQARGVPFGDDADGLVESVVPDGAGVLWTVDQAADGIPSAGDPALVQALGAVSWTSIARPHPAALGL